MIKHFCDICKKELMSGDTDRTTALQWYKLSKMTYSDNQSGEYEQYSAEICNDCLKSIVDEAKRMNVI